MSFNKNNYSKELYEQRKIEGICVRCGKNKADEGVVQCRDCRIKTNGYEVKKREKNKEKLCEKSKARYHRLKEQGLCVICGKNEQESGYVHCSSCREKQKKERKQTREFRLSLGICPSCGKNKLEGNEKNCIECSTKRFVKYDSKRVVDKEKSRERNKIKYWRYKNAGLCTWCGKPTNGYSLCETHRHKVNAKNRVEFPDNRTNWVEEGRCGVCGKHELKDGYKVCERCYDNCIEKLQSPKMIESREKIKRVEHNRYLHWKRSVANE